MKSLSTWLAWAAVALVAALAALNWSTLMIAAPVDLLFMELQLPLGAVLLGLAAVLVGLFFLAYLQQQIGSLLETRRLLKEIQRVQGLADKAEASRIENLHQLIATEFRLTNERLADLAKQLNVPLRPETGQAAPFNPSLPLLP